MALNVSTNLPPRVWVPFIISSQICAIFVLWRERKFTKRGRFFLKKVRVKGPKFYTFDRTCQASTIPSDKFKFAEKIWFWFEDDDDDGGKGRCRLLITFLTFQWFLKGRCLVYQRDQIGHLLKCFGDKFSHKSSPNVGLLLGYFEKAHIQAVVATRSTVLKKCGTFCSNIWSHCFV